MCPLWPAHYAILYLLSFAILWLASFQMVGAATNAIPKSIQYDVVFQPTELTELIMNTETQVNITIVPYKNQSDGEAGHQLNIIYYSEDTNLASVSPKGPVTVNSSDFFNEDGNGNYSSSVEIFGEFIGRTQVCAQVRNTEKETVAKNCMDVAVIRKPRPIDQAFTYAVIALVAIIYVNMGAALDIGVIKETLKRPFGPVIGFLSQFAIMPLLSYGIAKALIPNESLQLGLFITGCSPGGGASNIWTLTLGGNLDLSITMTTISTFSAFVMMPIWILYFGRLITDKAHLRIPNSRIATFAVGLVVPLLIGILIRRKFPKAAAFLVKMLKPFSIFLIAFIVVFAIYTNVYIFQLFDWQIIVAGMALPWLGYILGTLSAFLCRQSWKDSLAIGIETGVQNTGLAIFVLRLSLGQPDSDLTTVMPVSVALFTPVLPLLLLFGIKIHDCFNKPKKGAQDAENMATSTTQISTAF